jgi:putative tryptophan/tyrosine transport system substrate-binding protein
MERRGFLMVLSGAAIWPRATFAQRAANAVRRIGVLSALGNDPVGQAAAPQGLVEGLGALNWRDNVNVRIDWRWAGGDSALFERYAAELAGLGVDVIVAASTPAVAALRRQTRTIPIVFVIVTDPVGQRFVESLAHPGGNITGFTDFEPAMATKWLGMLAQITPSVAQVAVLFNPATAPFADLMLRAIEEAAPSFSIAVRAAPCQDDAAIEPMIRGLASEKGGGLLVLPDSFTIVHREALVALAASYRLPAIYWNRLFITGGGLMSYGVDNKDLFRRSADYVDRILKGAKPSDLPVQTPTKFVQAINLKTAKALGVTVAPLLLAQADEVIE